MREYFLSLPNVKSAEFVNPRIKHLLEVTFWNGPTIKFEVVLHPDSANPKRTTRQDMVRWLERHRSELEGALARGDCLFLFTKAIATFRIGATKVPQALPPVIAALSSDASNDKKFDTLELWNVITAGPSDRKTSSPLVRGFKGSQQLTDRIRGILEKHPRRPRPISRREHREIMQRVLKMPGTLAERRNMRRKLLEEKRKQIIAEFERGASSQP